MSPLGRPPAPAELACLLPLFLAPAGSPIHAQATDGGVGAWAGPTLSVTTVGDDFTPLLGADVGLVFGPHVRVSGAGYAVLGTVERPRAGTTPLELSMGYGGLVVQYLLGGRGAWRSGVSLMMGGGTARIRDPVADAELGSDNFVVLEPRFTLHLALRSFMELTVSGGFRLPRSVDDLPGVSRDDLEGPVGGIAVSVGSFRRP